MDTLRKVFNNIRQLKDIQPYLTSTSDGETSTLEFKSLQKDSFNSENKGKTKALLAKEICAFLNTNDGMILWGGGIDKDTHQAVICNESDKNLANFLDSIILTITEPSPTGIDSKMIQDDEGNEALLIFVPKSNFSPHRVGFWDAEEGKKSKDKILGRYFQRVGTSSHAIPENLVRSLYLSRGHLPTIEVRTEMSKIKDTNSIVLTTIVTPDRFDFIESYYLTCEVSLIGEYLEILDRNNPWIGLDSCKTDPFQKPPIYPSDKPYAIESNLVTPFFPKNDPLLAKTLKSNTRPEKDIHLDKEKFDKIFAIAMRTSFAAKGIQIKRQLRLYIIGMQDAWQYLIQSGKTKEQFRRVDKLKDLEKKYNTEIFVSLLYKDDDIICNQDGIESDSLHIKMSHLEQLLEELTKVD